MSFLSRHIKDVLTGGLPVLWGKTRALPDWIWKSPFVQILVCYYYRSIVFFRPGDAEAYFLLAKSLHRLNCIDEAIAKLEKAVSLRPDLSLAHVLLSELLIANNRFDEAYAAWEKVFHLEPDWTEVHSRIQNAFYYCGQTWAARNIMQKGLDDRNNFARNHQLDRLGIRILTEFPSAIGHIAVLDSYVKMDMLGWRSPDQPVLLVNPRLSNPCYLDYWRQYLPTIITDPEAIKLISPVARYLEDRIFTVMDSSCQQAVGEDYIGAALQSLIQERWETENRSPLLVLRDSDDERGRQRLEQLGVPVDSWFISLHVREGKTVSRGARDADITAYYKAIESVTTRGGWVIRMGDPSMTPLPSIPKVIDYAHSQLRVDWMDIFLWARCRFFIGTQSGPAWVPPTFGVPCVATNWTFLCRRWFGQDLFIPKLLWSEKENRYLTFAESLTSSVGVAESLDYFNSQGIRITDNTPEEINDVVIEMMDRLDGKLFYDDNDIQLQERFDRMWIQNSYKATGRIGRDFLKKWHHLL